MSHTDLPACLLAPSFTGYSLQECRTQLFSATMTSKLAKLQRACLRDCFRVEAVPPPPTHTHTHTHTHARHRHSVFHSLQERRTQLFSATMTSKVAKLQRACLRDPVKVEADAKYQTVSTLRQQFLFIPFKFKVGLCSRSASSSG